MKEELYREKSIKKIKSPENLDDYIRVSNTGVLIALIGVVVLLLGAVIWGCFGHLDTIVDGQVVESIKPISFLFN